MDKSDIQETLVLLYLRLNGYFGTGFIVHAPQRNKTEMDVLAIRLPSASGRTSNAFARSSFLGEICSPSFGAESKSGEGQRESR